MKLLEIQNSKERTSQDIWMEVRIPKTPNVYMIESIFDRNVL